MVPTLIATLGVKGHRPVVGTWDCKHLLYMFAVVNLVTAAIHANTRESPKDAKKRLARARLGECRRRSRRTCDTLHGIIRQTSTRVWCCFLSSSFGFLLRFRLSQLYPTRSFLGRSARHSRRRLASRGAAGMSECGPRRCFSGAVLRAITQFCLPAPKFHLLGVVSSAEERFARMGHGGVLP